VGGKKGEEGRGIGEGYQRLAEARIRTFCAIFARIPYVAGTKRVGVFFHVHQNDVEFQGGEVANLHIPKDLWPKIPRKFRGTLAQQVCRVCNWLALLGLRLKIPRKFRGTSLGTKTAVF
jgi:hypothetical protein